MRNSLFVASALLLFLTGCAMGFKPFGARASNNAQASIVVINDRIIVSQEPIYVEQQGENTISWFLDPFGPYFFPDTPRDKGIEFNPPPEFPGLRCRIDAEDKRKFTCTFPRAAKGKYRYTIKVTKDGTNIVQSDPTMLTD